MAMDTHIYLKLRAEKGLTALLPAHEVGPILFEYRRSNGRNEPGPAIYVMLPNNNRVEVLGETVESLLTKIGQATGRAPIVYDGDQVIEYRKLEPKPELEPQHA